MSPRYAYEPHRPTCDIEGCDRTRAVRGLCRPHYQQQWRAEHPGYQQAWKAANPERVAEYRDRYDRRTGRRRYAHG